MAEQSALSLVLKRYRAAVGLTQEQLADRAGVSTRAVSDLERGLHRTPHSDTLNRLAGALALSADQRTMLLAAAQPGLSTMSGMSGVAATSAGPVALLLPVPPTPLIGRAQERQRAIDWLRERSARLLTLTGPGGVGKTRLALAVAHDLASSFSDGVRYVELVSLRQTSQVPSTLATALGLREQSGQPLTEQIFTHLRENHLLLVLDNCEHLPHAAALIAELVARCPQLVILATSRAPLHLRAERILPLAPLPLNDAMALFHDRALAVWPDGMYDEPEVAAICTRLDCLPLAIELAAARVKVLALPQLRDYLAHRLPLLRGGAVDMPDRHRTMEDTIGWSYGLLSEEQQRCFRGLSVFAGSCTLDAARAVCCDPGAVTPHEAITTLSALVDASLLQSEVVGNGVVRFRLLELMREYALERLREASEADSFRRRHATYYAELVDDATHFGPGRLADDAGLARELPNAHAALEWAEANHDAVLGLRLTGFARVWYLRGSLSEALRWKERMLALDTRVRAQGGPSAPLSLRVRQLYGFSRILLAVGMSERAEIVAWEALQLAQEVGNVDHIGNAYATLGLIAQARGDLNAAAAAFAASATCAKSAAPGNLRHLALTNLAEIARARGDYSGAEELLTEALAAAQAVSNSLEAAMITTLLGHTARQRSYYAQARTHYCASLAHFSEFGSPTFLAWCLEGLAATLAAEGDMIHAVWFYAAAAALREGAGTPAPPQECTEIEEILDYARAQLGEQVFRAEWASAAALPPERIIVDALALAVEPQVAARARGPLVLGQALD